jgi:glycine oxidase
MHTENLIVGLGIAGINLCHQLEKQGKSFIVIDPCPSHSASLIAGGIYNPIAIKRKIKSWKADELFPFLVDAYREIEQLLETKFLVHDFPILKPIRSEAELEEWQTSIDKNVIPPFVDEVVRTAPKGPFHKSVIGYVIIKHSGFLRTDEAIFSYRNYLRKTGRLMEETLDFERLSHSESEVSYGNITADRVLFCDGQAIAINPFFKWIPMRSTKGEMLTVQANSPLEADKVYNQQFYLFPSREKNQFRLGATYDWNNLDEIPTIAAKEELLASVAKTLDIELEVLNQQAAIRPNSIDRRPAIGPHPIHRNVYLFNGMGSKGVMLAPYFAKQLVDSIYSGSDLHPEASLQRFVRKNYFSN